MKCCQCGKPAMYLVGQEGSQVPLCLECNLKHVQMIAIQNEMLEREMNFSLDMMDEISGIPSTRPRFPERKVIHMDGATFNNIRVDRSTIGALNTGSIESVDVAVGALQQSGDHKLSVAIQELTQAVISTIEVQKEAKNDILEILSVLSTEATAPKERRRSKAMKPLLKRLQQDWRNCGIVCGRS